MSRTPSAFWPADITRAIKVLVATGVSVTRGLNDDLGDLT